MSLKFPTIAPKTDLTVRTLLDDQIILIDGFLSKNESSSWSTFIDGLPLELTPPKKRGEADRVNYRYRADSVKFAATLYHLLLPHLPAFSQPASGKRKTQRPANTRKPDAFNSNIRLYKYLPGNHFGPHYDDSVRDAQTGLTSEWTLLIYVTGVEDGVEGGETLFYKSEKCRPEDTITPPLNRGTVLLHRHGRDCMLHEGSKVLRGTKYIIRSDLMFK